MLILPTDIMPIHFHPQVASSAHLVIILLLSKIT